MLTIVDPREYSPDEYNIVALPNEALRQQIIIIQEKLVRVLGGAIWLTPPDALHVTIMEITGPHTEPVSERQKRFELWQRAYSAIAKDIIAASSPITLRFNEIAVSQRAIIIKAANPEPLNKLRSALLAKTKLPEGTNLPPDIAHTTIARFSQAIDLAKMIQATEKLTIDCDEQVTGLSLLKDITPPDFNITTIDMYPFASQ